MSSPPDRAPDSVSAKVSEQSATITFVVQDFENRTEECGQCITSPTVQALGHTWKIRVYPRGKNDYEGFVSCYLRLDDNSTHFARFCYRCGDIEKYCFPRDFGKQVWGYNGLLKREDAITNHLEADGSLVIECDVRLETKSNNGVWYPNLTNSFQYASIESPIIALSVGEKIYQVHKNVLSLRCKILYDIVEASNNDAPIQIDFVREEIFLCLLEFLYSMKAPAIENKETGKELLIAANRFGCVLLKLYVESILVDKFLEARTAAELLLFADSHSCAMLKETATNLCITQEEIVKASEAWSLVEESKRLVEELLSSSVTTKCTMTIKNLKASDIHQMDVGTLRRELEWCKEDFDGSRGALVDRLKKRVAEKKYW